MRKYISQDPYVGLWVNFIPPRNARETATGFWDKATGEPVCPFRGTPCIWSKCSWWEEMKDQIMEDPYGERLLQWCWFFLCKYGMDAGHYIDCPKDPGQVLAMLKQEGYGGLPPLNVSDDL